MIVEYSTRFPFVSEIEVEGGEGEWRKPLEKSRYSDVARFTIRVLPGVSRSKANKTVFITGQGGKLVRCLRGAAVQNSRKQSSWCRHVSQSLLGMVALLFMGTCERFDVATISLAIVEKKWDGRGDFVGFVGDSVESLLYYYCNYLKTSLYSSL